MKKAINEMLEDRVDEASIKLSLNLEFSDLENKEEKLLKTISEASPKYINETIITLENNINDMITLSEEIMYKEGFRDAIRYCFETIKMMDNTGQKLDR